MATKPFSVKGQNVTSPKGSAKWCKITEPDYTYDDKGTLSTQLICNPDDPAVQAFIERLEELRDKALAETKETLGAKGKAYKAAPIFTEEKDSEEEPTGNIVFKFNLKKVDERAENNHQSTIIVVDAKRNKMAPSDVPLVGNGSVIRCVAFANPYSMPNTKTVGISLIWNKMQLIDLVEYAANDEFEDEDGYESADTDNDFDNEDDDF